MKLNDEVKAFWERGACGTSKTIVGELQPLSRPWFERVEEYRYDIEPCIHAIAQFSRHHGKRLLEVGVGAGTDHLQWARSGVECFGVDLTEAAISITQTRFDMYGFETKLTRLDAEVLPYPDNSFDLVYSWGVIHHAEDPAAILAEVRRVLKPGGLFIGMMYGRRSPLVFKFWVKYALLAGKPWKSFREIVWDKIESVGTKAYTVRELEPIFSAFDNVQLIPTITKHDTDHWPGWISKFFPDSWGWFIGIRAQKPCAE